MATAGFRWFCLALLAGLVFGQNQPDHNCYSNILTSTNEDGQVPTPYRCFGDIPKAANSFSDEDVDILEYNDSTTNFQPLRDITNYYLFVIIHDYQSTARDQWVRAMAKSLYERAMRDYPAVDQRYSANFDGVQVMAVDWSRASDYYYANAVGNAIEVASTVANHLNDLITDYARNPNSPFANIHCIGHGIGAHICGIASEVFKRGRPFWKPFNRITGLDPARALFEESEDAAWVNNSRRLDRSDAFYIDAIHTTQTYGYKAKTGLVDHFVNGQYGTTNINRQQPGCTSDACSHARAHELFLASIWANNDRCTFYGCDTGQQAKMCNLGYDSTVSCGYHVAAKFCGTTNPRPPFC